VKTILHENKKFSKELGYIEESQKRKQSVTSDWEPVHGFIDGVKVREVKNVCKKDGILTEVFRQDWLLDSGKIDQVFQNILESGQISGWHVHQFTTDRFFVTWGLMKIVLYDGRTESSTYGEINELFFGSARPTLVIIPPGVWHAVHNIHHEPSALLNLVDRAYQHRFGDLRAAPVTG